MNGIVKSLLIGLALISLFAAGSKAQTINAATCGSSDVQAALNQVAADGTTVNIPAGTCTWTATVTYSQKYSTTIQGQSTVSGTCGPGGTCTATDNTTITMNGSSLMTFHTAAGKSLQITGLTINVALSAPAYGAINFSGGSTSVRFDHNHINDTTSGGHTIQPDQIYGVFDHNLFDSTNYANVYFIEPTQNGADGNANTVWTAPDNFGSANFLFFENNVFQNGKFAIDCNFGGREVFRYNKVGYYTAIQTHGVGSGAERRGCRDIEAYGNQFNWSQSPNGSNACNGAPGSGTCPNPAQSYFNLLVDYESGPGLWWNNTETGYQNFLRWQNIRANNATYGQIPTPTGWGYCGTSFNGTGTAWDGSSSTGNGYPCLDGAGRGQGDLVTGSFPNKVNNTTGTISWPHQAVSPIYAWLNTINSVPNLSVNYWMSFNGTATAVPNEDYYIDDAVNCAAGGASCSSGVGHGTLAQRPVSCTTNPIAYPPGNSPGVGYWATDNSTLYVCTATSTWTAYYSPYTYPHPLTLGSGSGSSVAAPTNLTVIVQ
jgi:hypothetical protein